MRLSHAEPFPPGEAISPQIVLEERSQLVEWDQVHPVVEIDMSGARDDHKFLWLTGKPVGLFAELPAMRVPASDEQHRTRRDRLDVIKRIEVHELHVAGERRMGRGVRAVASGRAVEVIELAINRGRLVVQLFRRSAGLLDFTARKLNVALLRGLLQDVLSL